MGTLDSPEKGCLYLIILETAFILPSVAYCHNQIRRNMLTS